MRRLKFFVLFFWTLGLLALTLWRFPLPMPDGLSVLRALFAAVALSLAALASGRALLLKFKLYHSSWVEELCFSFGLGLVVLSLGGALLEAAGVFYVWVAWAALGALHLVFWEHLEALGEALWRNLRSKHPWDGSSTEVGTLMALGLSGLVALMLALAPPSFYDALVYHLASVHRTAQSGAFVPQKAVLFSWLPSLPRPLWVWALLLEGQPRGWMAPAFLTLALGLGLGLSLLDTSARLLAQRRLWLAPALALCQPLLLLSFGVFSPDGWMAAFSFWSLQAFLLALGERVRRAQGAWLLLSALLAGAAVACKPVALAHVAALLGLAAVLAMRDRAWRRPGLLVAGLGLFLLPLLPWLLQGALRLGQPSYPFPLRFLGWSWGAGAPGGYFEHLQDFGGKAWWTFLQLPYTLFYEPGYLGGGGHLSFLLLALVPMALAWRLSRELRWCLAYLGLGLFFWALGPHVLRYALFLVAPASLLAAQGVLEAEVWSLSRGWTYVWRGLVLGGLLLGSGHSLLIAVKGFDPLPVALGLIEPEEHLMKLGVSQAKTGAWLRAQEGPRARVLVIGDARGAWLPAGSLCVSVFEAHPFADWLAEAQSPEELDARIKREGYKLVLIDLKEWERTRAGGPFTALWRQDDPEGEAHFKVWVDHLNALEPERRMRAGSALAVSLP